MYLGGNRRWVPLSIKLVGSKFNRDRSLHRYLILVILTIPERLRARSIQPKFPEISVQNSMDRFGPTEKVSKKRVHLLRWTNFPGRTGWNFG